MTSSATKDPYLKRYGGPYNPEAVYGRLSEFRHVSGEAMIEAAQRLTYFLLKDVKEIKKYGQSRVEFGSVTIRNQIQRSLFEILRDPKEDEERKKQALNIVVNTIVEGRPIVVENMLKAVATSLKDERNEKSTAMIINSILNPKRGSKLRSSIIEIFRKIKMENIHDRDMAERLDRYVPDLGYANILKLNRY